MLPSYTRWFSSRMITALPTLMSAGVAAALVWYGNLLQWNMPLILGIIAGGLSDLDNRLTGRIKNIFFTLASFATASLAVEWTFGRPIVFTAVLIVLTFSFILIGTFGLRYRTIAFGTIVVALYTAITHSNATAWYVNPLLIVCGTTLYSVCTLLIHLVFSHRPVQDNMGRALLALADYLDAKAVFFDPDDTESLEQRQIRFAMKNAQVVEAFNLVRNALFYRLRGQHRHPRTTRMLHYYFAAQDIHERISSSYVEHGSFVDALYHNDLLFRIQRLLEWQAQTCRDAAYSLHHDNPPPRTDRLERAMNGINRAMQHHAWHLDPDTSGSLQRLIDNLAGVNYQLTHLGDAALDAEYTANSDQNRIAGQDVRGLRSMRHTLQSHFSFQSSVFRHAVRLSLVTALAAILIEGFDLPLGYWMLLTAVFICQPNYSATKNRLKQRVIGTVAGVLAGSVLPYFTPSLETRLAVVVLASTLFFFFRANKYSYANFFITLQAVVSFSIAGMDVGQALPQRLLDTVIGAGISWLAVSFLWPDWRYTTLKTTAERALSSSAAYLNAITAQLQQHRRRDDVGYRTVRRLAHEDAAQLSSTLSDMAGEANRYAAQLDNGFTLLKTNYALIAYISTLGAYRSRLDQSHAASDEFTDTFSGIAADTAALLAQLPQLNDADFAAEAAHQQQALQQLHATNDDERLLHRQLERIHRLLPTLHNAIRVEHHVGNTHQEHGDPHISDNPSDIS